ncbi:MAG: response regulator [Nitrospirales bacterium]
MATILIVDDEQMICDLLRAVLSRHGHEVFTTTTGREALELFRQHRPDITLLDLRMPEMDGMEVLKQIRAHDPQANVMVLAGMGADDLENKARQLGASDFLRKRLSLEVLFGALEREIQQQAVRARSEDLPSRGSAAERKEGDLVLVVDDELITRSLVSDFLSLRGFRVRTAQDGPEALALVEQERPDMIVLDMYMPGMNGVEVLRELRTKKNYIGGVVVLTASQDEKLLQETLELGSVDVMAKPVDLERLVVALHAGLALSAV